MKSIVISLARSWNLAARTRIVIGPAAIAAAAWALVLALIGDADRAPDALVWIGYALLYITTAGSVACTTIFASERSESTSVRGRTTSAVIAALFLGFAGTAVAALLQSFLAAWFLSAFLFMYALPLIVIGKRNWLAGVSASLRLAFHRSVTTFVAAAIIEAIAVAALFVGFTLSRIPYAGNFLQALVLQVAMGFCAVFALQRFIAVACVEEARLAARPRVETAATHFPQAS